MMGGWYKNNAGETTYIDSIYKYNINESKTREEEIYDKINNGNITRDELEYAISSLPESPEKDDLLDVFDKIKDTLPDMPTFTPETVTSNLDIYIKSENMLSLSLDTNSITFENYSGVEDMEKLNAINLTVSSSLPYEVNSYLATEMQNANKNETLDKNILHVKESSQSVYKQFANTTDAIRLLDNQIAGNDNVHSVDLKLATSLAYKADVYKATLKFEVNQK